MPWTCEEEGTTQWEAGSEVDAAGLRNYVGDLKTLLCLPSLDFGWDIEAANPTPIA